jgi:putative ABC transport system substrate-binding protein
MKRRHFMMLAGGAIMAWPLVGRAQQGRVRRVGMLLPATATDPEYLVLVNAFVQKLQQLSGPKAATLELKHAGPEVKQTPIVDLQMNWSR